MICFAVFARSNARLLARHVENLRRFNPGCRILLYNGGLCEDLGKGMPLDICPYSRPLPANRTARYLLAILRWLDETNREFDYLVCTDLETMFVRTGFEDLLNRLMNGYDCMGIHMAIHDSRENDAPRPASRSIREEWSHWQPLFHSDYFYSAMRTMQVYRQSIARKMARWVHFPQLEYRLETTAANLPEEILGVTLAGVCGGQLRGYPPEMVEGVRTDPSHVSTAETPKITRHPHVYFVHPVAYRDDDTTEPSPNTNSAESLVPACPRTLTIVWGCYQGGVETALFNRLAFLNRLGSSHHVWFYHGGPGLDNYSDIPYRVGKDRDQLAAYIQEHRFDVITWVNSLYNLDLLKEIDYTGNVLFEFHGTTRGILDALQQINEGREEGRIGGIVVPGRSVARIAKICLDRRNNLPIYIAHNTLDTQRFTKQSVRSFMKRYRIPDPWIQTPLVGWVGRLDASKNWSLLLNIFRKLKSKQPKIRLLLASDLTLSPDLNEFFRAAARLRLLDDLLVLGNIPYAKMPYFYSTIAASGGLLLSTSRSEGYPYHLLEAQGCFCPVVCTAIDGSTEIVQHKFSGFTFPINQPGRALLYIQRLLTDPALRRTIAANARESVCQRNEIRQNVLAYVDWLRELPVR
jgi:glycosyltransferase involved in cell wall biosynthesis